MGVSANNNLLLNARKYEGESLFRRDGRKDFLVITRGGMTEQDISQPLNVESYLFW